MSNCMEFPDTVEEFMEQYKIVDTEHIYSNGTEYVPIFRMKQWFEHLSSAERKTGKWIVSDDKYWHTCPFCNADIDVSMGTGVYVGNDEVNHVNYCPNCGCKMEVEG